MNDKEFKERTEDITHQTLYLTELVYEAKDWIGERNFDKADYILHEFDWKLSEFKDDHRYLVESKMDTSIGKLTDCIRALLTETGRNLEWKIERLETLEGF